MFGLLLGTELVGEAGLQLDSNCRVVCVAIGPCFFVKLDFEIAVDQKT